MDDHRSTSPLIEGYVAALVSQRAEDDRSHSMTPLMDATVEDDEDGLHQTFIRCNGMKFGIEVFYVGPDVTEIIEEVI